MNATATALTELFNRIPRRHSAENLEEINAILTEYEDLLIDIEAINSFYEKSVAVFFDDLETVKASIKKSKDNKASKKMKDVYFDEAAGLLKDSVEGMITVFGDGKRTA